MPVALYLDAHIPRAITNGLRLRNVDVITAQEDQADQLSDSDLLDRATVLRRTLFTFDDDLLAEAARRQAENTAFAGVIYAHPLRVSIGRCIRDLELLAQVTELAELHGQVIFLPL